MSGADLLSGASAHFENESLFPEKSPGALRTISEVSELLDVPQHVLRFWETKFAQITPLKRNGGRRFYRPEDIEVLQQVKFLLYRQGYTIKGAKKAIEDYVRILSSTQTEVGKAAVETVIPPANVNDNFSAPPVPSGIDLALGESALAALRSELLETRNALAARLGVSQIQ